MTNSLLHTQRRLMDALMQPIFGPSRALSPLEPNEGKLSESAKASATELIAPSPKLDSCQRLELYHRQVWYRLLDSIAEDFPALRKLLGETEFWSLIEAYLLVNPPQDHSLQTLGSALPGFLKNQGQPAIVQDLAGIEYALCLALEAATGATADAASIASIPLALAPHVQLLSLSSRAGEFWLACDAEDECLPELQTASGESDYVAVFRDGFSPQIERISAAQITLLQGIQKHNSLSAAIDSLMQQAQLLETANTTSIGQWFALWASRGWFCHPQNKVGGRLS